MPATVSFSGPLFDGRAQSITQRMITDITKDVTRETEKRVTITGQASFRYADKSRHQVPGKWRSRMHSEIRDADGVVSNDVIYGPWLEGTGSRNQTTRFKGYRMWRLTAQAMDRSGAREVYTPIVNRAVRELNG